MVSFEIANLKLEESENETILYTRFMDDNDPRLILVITYHKLLETTYFKVGKIEKSRKYFERHIAESDGKIRVTSIPMLEKEVQPV